MLEKGKKMKEALSQILKLLRLQSIAKKIRDPGTYAESADITWKDQMMNFYSQFVKKGDLCFDVGANVGIITQIFLRLGAKVVCVEPEKNCLRQLHGRFDKNPDVKIVGKALGEREGQGSLMICKEANTINTMSKEWKEKGRFSEDHKWTRTQTVTVTTLDNLVKLYGLPKFCKIDVEGFEKSVLKGLTKPIPFLSFEFTKEFFSESKNILDHLSSMGYKEFKSTYGDTNQLLFGPQWLKPEELSRKIDAVDDKLLWGNIYAKIGP